MSVSLQNIYWIAGILEGEGSFGYHDPKRDRERGYTKRPLIQLKMTDGDIVERVSQIMGGKCRGPYKRKAKTKSGERCKDYYLLSLPMNKAVQWMMTLYPLMGSRRKDKIEEILTYWKENHVGKGNRLNNPRMYKLSGDDIRDIRKKYVPRKYSINMLAKEYGVNQTTIYNVLNFDSGCHSDKKNAVGCKEYESE